MTEDCPQKDSPFKLLYGSLRAVLKQSVSRVMAKEPKSKPDSRQIFVTLPKGARALFNQLVDRKLYGEDNSSVGRHLIMIGP